MCRPFLAAIPPRRLAGLVFLAVAAGCESFGTALQAWSASTAGSHSHLQREEDARRRFQTDGDPEALQWLLANCIESGMAVGDVDRVLGEQGVRELDDGWLKTNGGTYQVGDVAYRWGPDRSGRSVYLIFRDGELVNFDPDEYR